MRGSPVHDIVEYIRDLQKAHKYTHAVAVATLIVTLLAIVVGAAGVWATVISWTPKSIGHDEWYPGHPVKKLDSSPRATAPLKVLRVDGKPPVAIGAKPSSTPQASAAAEGALSGSKTIHEEIHVMETSGDSGKAPSITVQVNTVVRPPEASTEMRAALAAEVERLVKKREAARHAEAERALTRRLRKIREAEHSRRARARLHRERL